MANPTKLLSQGQLESLLSRQDMRLFRQFLRDQRDRLMEQWAAGQDMDLRHQTKALLLGELASLEWADYAQFYDLPSEQSGGPDHEG